MLTFTHQLQQMKRIRSRDGIRPALIYLNGLTDHRFSALYRFSGDRLKNLYFYDREHPSVDSCAEIPVMASYCVFVREAKDLFMTVDSLTDDRIRNHPKRLEIRSYCGVPLMDENDMMIGTICHFDVRPLSISEEHIALMEAMSPLPSNDAVS